MQQDFGHNFPVPAKRRSCRSREPRLCWKCLEWPNKPVPKSKNPLPLVRRGVFTSSPRFLLDQQPQCFDDDRCPRARATYLLELIHRLDDIAGQIDRDKNAASCPPPFPVGDNSLRRGGAFWLAHVFQETPISAILQPQGRRNRQKRPEIRKFCLRTGPSFAKNARSEAAFSRKISAFDRIRRGIGKISPVFDDVT